MFSFNPAEMRHRITFQNKSRTQDADGIESAPWANVATAIDVPAKFKFISGKEMMSSNQIMAEFKARVTIYKRTDIDESMRISFDSKYFDIMEIIPDPTNALYQVLMVRKYGTS